jgi:transposase InsO family protein
MAGKVLAMDVKMLVATLPDDVKLAPWCRRLGISRQTAYKWRARYRREGRAGLEERSRAAKRPAGRISAELEDQIVAARKWLCDVGLDGGPGSVWSLLTDQGVAGVPSEATIWRVFVRRGQIVPQPRKRPKVAYRRFVRERPNECWQIDATHTELGTGRVVEIINLIDDCSRLCVESLAVAVCTSPTAWKAFSRAAERYGLPAELLSDNGAAFRSVATGARPVVFERNLLALGVRTLHSRPHHPQTCGKVERFHQTQQRWFAARPAPDSIEELQRLLDAFRDIYNHHRPHRGIGRRRPGDVWAALPKAHPVRVATEHETLVRTHQVWSAGAITLANNCIVMLGRAHAGTQVTTIRRGDHLTVIATETGDILREFTIDPTRTHQTRGLRASTRPT